MHKYLISLSFLIATLTVQAQTTEDVIYLKNGSILRGQIVGHKTDSVVKIMITGGNVWAVPASEVTSINREKPFQDYQRYLEKKRGLNVMLNTGIFFPVSGDKSSYFHVSAISSWSVWPNFSVGIGGSIDRDMRTYCPVYLDARYYLNQKYFAPFISFSCGKALAWDKEVNVEWRKMRNYGELYCSGSIGIELPQKRNMSILLAIEYKYQKNHLKSLPQDTYYELIEENNRIGVKLGLLFN